MQNLFHFLPALTLLLTCHHVRADDPPASQLLFDSGREGYPRYRIPSLIVTPKGTVLAICEGRKGGLGLDGDIDIVLKRSHDHGQTWQPLEVIADDGPHTLGNPCPVIDATTGTIWLALTRSHGSDTEDAIVAGTSQETTRVMVTSSTDDGVTWSKLRDISAASREESWTWYGTGPGIGIQLKSGRLVIPSYHAQAGTKIYRSHTIYSDDHGETWKLGATVGEHCTECQVAQRRDGSLLLSARSIEGERTRTTAVSTDGGATWSNVGRDKLYDPNCQAALYVMPLSPRPRFGGEGQGEGASAPNDSPIWLFCHPAGPDRRNLTVRLSTDEGRTWPKSRLLKQGDGQYSCLAKLGDGQIGCLYDCWTDGNYRLFFTRFEVKSLK